MAPTQIRVFGTTAQLIDSVVVNAHERFAVRTRGIAARDSLGANSGERKHHNRAREPR